MRARSSLDEHVLLARYPPPQALDATTVAAAATGARRLVVLDDDPTGTQAVADVPVVTAWEPDDIRWALRQDTPGFYVLTNTRSVSEESAARLNQDVLEIVMSVSAEQQVDVTFVSRSDSTLRGHFPLETDVLAAGLRARGHPVDGVALLPAFIDAGRITVDSVHWVRTPAGMVMASETEFAQDPEFGYSSSALQDYVAEKSRGRWSSESVARITLGQLRSDAATAEVVDLLATLRDGQPVVVDAASDADLRVFALAAIAAEQQGINLLYRTGPSFVRNRLGQAQHPPIADEALAAALGEIASRASAEADQVRSAHGLVVAGSYVGLTTRQLDGLATLDGLEWITLDVAELAASGAPEQLVDALASSVADALATRDVVLATSRTRLAAPDETASRAIQAEVSSALIEVVRRAVGQRRPRWLVAKGGITSSDIATRALHIRRAWVRGTLLPGIVSLWEPANPWARQIPYVVFPGNVGDADSLRAVVVRLRQASLAAGDQASSA